MTQERVHPTHTGALFYYFGVLFLSEFECSVAAPRCSFELCLCSHRYNRSLVFQALWLRVDSRAPLQLITQLCVLCGREKINKICLPFYTVNCINSSTNRDGTKHKRRAISVILCMRACFLREWLKFYVRRKFLGCQKSSWALNSLS